MVDAEDRLTEFFYVPQEEIGYADILRSCWDAMVSTDTPENPAAPLLARLSQAGISVKYTPSSSMADFRGIMGEYDEHLRTLNFDITDSPSTALEPFHYLLIRAVQHSYATDDWPQGELEDAARWALNEAHARFSSSRLNLGEVVKAVHSGSAMYMLPWSAAAIDDSDAQAPAGVQLPYSKKQLESSLYGPLNTIARTYATLGGQGEPWGAIDRAVARLIATSPIEAGRNGFSCDAFTHRILELERSLGNGHSSAHGILRRNVFLLHRDWRAELVEFSELAGPIFEKLAANPAFLPWLADDLDRAPHADGQRSALSQYFEGIDIAVANPSDRLPGGQRVGTTPYLKVRMILESP